MRVSRVIKIAALSLLALVVVGGGGLAFLIYRGLHRDPFLPLYTQNCAVCHGDAFQGAAQGPALVGRALTHGETVEQIAGSIAAGFPQRGMPAWAATLSGAQIQSLAILVAERR